MLNDLLLITHGEMIEFYVNMTYIPCHTYSNTSFTSDNYVHVYGCQNEYFCCGFFFFCRSRELVKKVRVCQWRGIARARARAAHHHSPQKRTQLGHFPALNPTSRTNGDSRANLSQTGRRFPSRRAWTELRSAKVKYATPVLGPIHKT